jgi:hypothetical protein
MPFTFSHPAAVLPFYFLPKKWISLTGLVVGSITPDFEYFIRMEKLSVHSHSWTGLLWFDLPMGVLLTFIYYGIVHKPLINNLPAALKGRLLQYAGFDWNKTFKKNWSVILVCIFIGATSHIIWDSLTATTVFYLNNSLSIKKHISYFSFWSISSLIGGLIIAFAFYQLPSDKNTKINKSIVSFWIIAMCIALLVFFVRTFTRGYLFETDYIVSAISAMMIAIILTSLLFKNRT